MSIRKPGSPTCWPGFQITPPTKSPTCFHGIGRRTNSSRPPLLPERFAADYRACLGCWPDAYEQQTLNLGASGLGTVWVALVILVEGWQPRPGPASGADWRRTPSQNPVSSTAWHPTPDVSRRSSSYP